jgi:hypothetical protein
VVYPTIEFVLALTQKFVSSDAVFSETGSYIEKII